MHLFAGIDLGTSGLRAVLIDEGGRVRGAAEAGYPIRTPAPGVAEQLPEDWWAALRTALAGALRAAGGAGVQVAALGLSGQMHGIVALDGAGAPLRPALIWADQRGADEVARIEALIAREQLLAVAGSRASVGFSAPKILWLRRHEPDIFARCRLLLLPKDYLGLRLTGLAASEPTDGAATLLFDQARRDWSDALLELLDIPRALLPPLLPSLASRGPLLPGPAAELGLPPGIPVMAGAGDTPCQAAAYGGLRPGAVLATISSGGQLLAPVDTPLTDPQGRIHTLCHVVPQRWYLLGAMQAAGLGLRWLRDLWGGDAAPPAYETLLGEAAAVPPGADGLFFLPYLLGERTPHMDNSARAAFVGLTLRHGRPALVRAVLEGVAFAFRDGLEVFRSLGLRSDNVRLGGGGSRSPLWCQIMADVLGAPVELTDAEHGAALGAALIAGVGAGAFPDLEQAAALAVHPTATLAPDPERAARYDALYPLFRGLYPSLRAHFAAL
ncbi:MAG TPA: xylulokinase [Roseiflexaceae bacterium]|nr:xylulokinase [Roseiflexaceae bacterium]